MNIGTQDSRKEGNMSSMVNLAAGFVLGFALSKTIRSMKYRMTNKAITWALAAAGAAAVCYLNII